jgi:aspartate kinase
MSGEAHGRIHVIKIGGSVLTGVAAYRQCAEAIARRIASEADERLVIVVSAQEGHTDALLAEARRLSPEPDQAALDLLWSSGEVRSAALLVLALRARGASAVALAVHEVGLRAEAGGAARLHTPLRLRDALAAHRIVVVPGFLATRASGGIVSLGRGGSDLTAVLIAAGLRAERCELIKDVPGYFTSDPAADPGAAHLERITMGRALAMADAGCDLVQRAAIEAAARARIPLTVRTLDEAARATSLEV